MSLAPLRQCSDKLLIDNEQALPAPSVLTEAKSGFGLLDPIQSRMNQPSSRPILRGFSAAIHQGEMLLVIGKPGSGCTTLLKTLAGMWSEYKGVSGDLTFGGEPMKSVIDNHPQDVVFCGKHPFLVLFAFYVESSRGLTRYRRVR